MDRTNLIIISIILVLCLIVYVKYIQTNKQLNDANVIIESIVPEKDVDGFSSENIGKLSLKKPFISPCTPRGVMKMLASIKCDLRGKDS